MNTELFDAILAGDIAKTGSMLKSGVDVNTSNDEGATLLMQAAATGKLEMVELLVRSGANVNAEDSRGWTALMKALFNYELNRGFPEIVSFLIEAGANIEHQISYGTRPLMLAAGYGEAGVVEVLLAAGADVNAENEGGRTAKVMAETKDYVEVINLLYISELNSSVEKKGACSSIGETPSKTNVVKFMRNPLH